MRNVNVMSTRSARPADVDMVIIDGFVHKLKKRLLRVDAAALMDEADAIIAKLRAHAKGLRTPNEKTR